jgi:hypothetical protein
MDVNKLFCLNDRIVARAVDWRDQQSALTQLMHSATLTGLRDFWAYVPAQVLGVLCREQSAAVQKCGLKVVASAVEAFIGSEFTELSAVFNGLYSEFNGYYFSQRLPAYYVKVIHAKETTRLRSDYGMVDEQRREIEISYDGFPEVMIGVLMDTMALIASKLEPAADVKAELRRLDDAGAPTGDRVAEFDVTWGQEGSGWRYEERLKSRLWTPDELRIFEMDCQSMMKRV